VPGCHTTNLRCGTCTPCDAARAAQKR
jgi:hypothetical protein